MDLSVPWTPSLKGKHCPTSILYRSVYDAYPNSISHKPWAKKTLESELEKRPEAREALWESILMLWRLSLTMRKAPSNTNWLNLVSAWLHRHRDICQHLNIPPYKVVLDFVTQLRADELLDVDIPSWGEPTPIPSSGPDQHPNRSRRMRGKSQATTTASNPRRGRNIKTVEPTLPLTTRSAQKRKERAQSNDDASISMGGSQTEQSDTRNAMFEPELQETPQPKRPRETIVRARPEDWLDLSGYQFIEEMRISQELPMAEGKVCTECSGMEQLCGPIWYKGRATIPISCEPCIYRNANCSFMYTDWGVKTWPNLQPNSSSSSHRMRKARKPGRDTRNQGYFLQDVLTPPTPLPRLQPSPPAPDVATLTMDNPPMSASESHPLGPQVHSNKPDATTLAMLSGKLGLNYSISLELFNPFEDTLRNKGATPLEARTMAAELSAIRRREKEQVYAFLRLIEGREAITDLLISDLLAKAVAIESGIVVENTTHRGATQNTSGRDDGSTTIKVPQGDKDHVADLPSVSRAAMEGVVRSGPSADAETTLHRDKGTGVGSVGIFDEEQ